MTPKEKAVELYYKFYTTLLPTVRMRHEIVKQHALIAVDEIISEYNRMERYNFVIEKEYLQEVKTEIEKL